MTSTKRDFRGLSVSGFDDQQWFGTEKQAREFNSGMTNIARDVTQLMFPSIVVGKDTRASAKERKQKATKPKRCADCRRILMQQHFSTNQWSKPAPRCSACCVGAK